MKKIISITFLALIISSCARHLQLQNSFNANIKHPQKVALILPLHGDLARSGKAIRNGFLAAYYYSMQQGQPSTAIQILDSSKQDVRVLYQNAIDKGAEFIIGPLTKNNVAKIATMDSLKVPTLALNTINNYTSISSPSNLYQFGLSSQDEIYQAAAKAWQASPGRALIIVPNIAWGSNLATALENIWQSFGGTVTATLKYNNNNLAAQIRNILNINESQKNARILRYILGEKFKFIPRRRQDIDVIFLISFPKQAREIRPLLKFYFAGNIPVYAISSIYNGIQSSSLNRDLDGIHFCDMPWIVKPPTNLSPVLAALRANIIKLWPNSYRHYPRLYALGIDAYYLMLNINRLLQNPQAGITGATGDFYLDNYRHIYRRLTWATFQNGIAHAD